LCGNARDTWLLQMQRAAVFAAGHRTSTVTVSALVAGVRESLAFAGRPDWL